MGDVPVHSHPPNVKFSARLTVIFAWHYNLTFGCRRYLRFVTTGGLGPFWLRRGSFRVTSGFDSPAVGLSGEANEAPGAMPLALAIRR